MRILLALLPLLLSAQPYQVIFLRPDPSRTKISMEEGERIQKAHMAYIRSMAERGVLLAAGPFGDKVHTISGVFFFNSNTKEAALAEAAKDPTVTEHRNRIDVLEWQGPKGLGEEYKRLHKQNPQTPEGMGVHTFLMLRRTATWSPNAAHEAYLAELKAQGKLAAAGAVVGDASVAEILIFSRIPDEEAARLVAADPAVKNGSLEVESRRWWSAAHVLPGN